jgi:hypothetical protein
MVFSCKIPNLFYQFGPQQLRYITILKDSSILSCFASKIELLLFLLELEQLDICLASVVADPTDVVKLVLAIGSLSSSADPSVVIAVDAMLASFMFSLFCRDEKNSSKTILW